MTTKENIKNLLNIAGKVLLEIEESHEIDDIEVDGQVVPLYELAWRLKNTSDKLHPTVEVKV